MNKIDFPQAFSLKGRHALITGGGTGLGLGMARCFIAAGAKVTLVGRRETELVAAVAELGSSAFYVAHDVTNLSGCIGLLDRAEAAAGPLDILVNNAGIHLKKSVEETEDAEFHAVIQTHVFGAFALSRETGKRLLQRGAEGSFLFTASMASLFGIPLVSAYSAAKSAYVGLVRSLAAEWSGRGIRINAIAPGWIQSEMVDKALAGDSIRSAKILGRTPMARLGKPEDIGWAAVYLCSPAAKFVTGVILPVDGGASMGF